MRHDIFLALILTLLAPCADAAAFAKFSGIDGESKGDAAGGDIELVSVTSRMDLVPASLAASGTTAASGTLLGDLTFTKYADKSSPKLSEAVCKGKVFPKVDIYISSGSNEGRQAYLKYEMENVRVTSYSVGGASSSDERPTESVTLNFEKIKVTYEDQDGLRSKGRGKVEASWKVEEGEK